MTEGFPEAAETEEETQEASELRGMTEEAHSLLTVPKGKDRILKAATEKQLTTYKEILIQMTMEGCLLTQSHKGQKQVAQELNERTINCEFCIW